MALKNLLNTGRFNIFSFASLVASEETSVEVCYEAGLIPRLLICNEGHGVMNRRNDPNYPLGHRWMCNLCKKKASPLQNTIFAGTRLDFSTALKLLALWFWRIPVTQAAEHAEVTRTSAIKFYRLCRKIASIVQGHDMTRIGGRGDIVEVDESHLFKKKYGRGRNLKASIWVFGAISRATRRAYITRIENKRRDTLFPIMQEAIAPGSFIMSDEHKSYKTCARLGFKGHASVNHSKTYVRPRNARITGVLAGLGTPTRLASSRGRRLYSVKVHTNTCERMWRDLKAKLRTVREPAMLPFYIGEYLYRKNTFSGIKGSGHKFARFIEDVRRVYPGGGMEGIRRINCTCDACQA